jgi:hypothetical protein
MKENVKCAWDQYMDGAITYVEFVRVAIAAVTKEDVDGHNAPYAGLKSAGADMYRADWPFAG